MEYAPKPKQTQPSISQIPASNESSVDTSAPIPVQTPRMQQIPSAHDLPLVNGNLNVPGDAKFSKRQLNPENFSPELRNLSIAEHLDATLFKPIIESVEKNTKKFPEKTMEEKINIIQDIRSHTIKGLIEASKLDQNLNSIRQNMSIEEYKEILKSEKVKALLNARKNISIEIYNNLRSLFENFDFGSLYQLSTELKNLFPQNIKISSVLSSFIKTPHGAIFKNKPCIDDIRQTKLGDCYLVATLMSIVNSPKYGPDFIMNMMRDNGDGSITVRLYKPQFDENGNAISFNPRYYKVNKACIYKDYHSALWVQIIEKAYAIGGFYNLKLKGMLNFAKHHPIGEQELKDLEQTYNNFKSTKRDINQIEGRNSVYALMVITGNPAKNFTWNDHKQIDNISNLSLFKDDDNSFDFIKNRLDLGFPIIFGTNAKFFDQSSFPKKVPNLINNHEYAIIETNEKGSEPYITLLNPWDLKDDSPKKKIEISKTILEENKKFIQLISFPISP